VAAVLLVSARFRQRQGAIKTRERFFRLEYSLFGDHIERGGRIAMKRHASVLSFRENKRNPQAVSCL